MLGKVTFLLCVDTSATNATQGAKNNLFLQSLLQLDGKVFMFNRLLYAAPLVMAPHAACFAADIPVQVVIDPQSARPLKPAIFSTATVWDLGGVRPENPMLVKLMRRLCG